MIRARYQYEREEDEHYHVDNNVFYCDSCSRCWEVEGRGDIDGEGNYSRYFRALYYSEFPSIGKKRKKCPHCNE